MVTKVWSCAFEGISAYTVEVEVDAHKGSLPSVVIVGLPDAAVKESKDRIQSALLNLHYEFPKRKSIVINLAPGDTRKEGPGFDLPIAVGLLHETGVVELDGFEDYFFYGELALNADLRSIKGALSAALHAKQHGARGIVLPYENCREASVVEGIDVIPVRNLSDVIGFFAGGVPIKPLKANYDKFYADTLHTDIDFKDVKGQEHVKRALTVAAAGGHNVLMMGPPGAGKTMLAKRLPTILPRLSLEEAVDTTKIYSIAGMLPQKAGLITQRPFRTPHHTTSSVGLIGGGSNPRPGEVSLAHNGILFLDELPEFSRKTLEVLRQPLEDGKVTISRAIRSVDYPAKISLIVAMNPCPCGYYTDEKKECTCSGYMIQKYLSRISGPLLDRIDIQIEVSALNYKELTEETEGESSADIRKKVEKVRDIQRKRFNSGENTNSHMSERNLKKHCVLGKDASALLRDIVDRMGFSARGYTKILKVGRTIADLAGSDDIQLDHVAEAVQYRTLDRVVL